MINFPLIFLIGVIIISVVGYFVQQARSNKLQNVREILRGRWAREMEDQKRAKAWLNATLPCKKILVLDLCYAKPDDADESLGNLIDLYKLSGSDVETSKVEEGIQICREIMNSISGDNAKEAEDKGELIVDLAEGLVVPLNELPGADFTFEEVNHELEAELG